MRLNTPADRPFRRLGFLSSRLSQDLKSARPIVPVRSACLELFIGFSAGVVGLAISKGTKTNAKPMQNWFSLTPESTRRPFGVSLRTFDQRRSLRPRRLGENPTAGR